MAPARAGGQATRAAHRLLAVRLLVGVGCLIRAACAYVDHGPKFVPDLYTYTIRNTYAHDPDSFTQGLLYYPDRPGVLYESAGLYGESTLREVNLTTGQVIKSISLPKRDFAEGLALHRDRLIQLTWRSSKGFVYDRDTFELLRTIYTPLRDGWGLTNESPESEELVATDSGSQLFFLHPETFDIIRAVQVTDNGRPIKFLNELEWINGEIWANIWLTECIARIDPKTGRVNGWVMLQGLKGNLMGERIPQRRRMDVLNGIAWDPDRKRLFITGKLWPRLYEVELRKIEWPPEMDIESSRRMCIK